MMTFYLLLISISPARVMAQDVERGLASYLAADFASARQELTSAADWEATDGLALLVRGLMHAGGQGGPQDREAAWRDVLDSFLTETNTTGYAGFVLFAITVMVMHADMVTDEELGDFLFGQLTMREQETRIPSQSSNPNILADREKHIASALPYIQAAAANGVIEAKLAIYALADEGMITGYDKAKALDLARAFSSSPLGHAAFGKVLADPVGTPDSERTALALHHLSIAASAGHLPTQLYLAGSYREGRLTPRLEIPQDLPAAFGLYQAVAEAGIAEAQFRLGQFYNNSAGMDGVVPKDAEIAKSWFLRAAEQGHVEGMYALAMLLVAQNEAGLGDEWMVRAAQAGHPNAALFISTILTAQGKAREAFELLVPPAEAGDSTAQYLVGDALAYGRGVSADLTAAARWYRRAAEGGDVRAQLAYGRALNDGKGVTQDQAAGMRWIRQAADAGNPAAQADIALALARGTGVERNDETALYYARKSALQGNRGGQYYLAQLLLSQAERLGTPPVEAMGWFLIARENGENDEERIGRAERALNSAQLARAREMAQRCLGSKYDNCAP